ncbi:MULTISPECIES: riboflavin synthase [Weeksella]|uniref:Riboflavin synthase n=1 Tax=Weeksella virosa (strain ATCC 43766 / DSM 16922 / JCM 21250 / CCUG 30538 / CDC 9751 / IAM 14551 / NBRC 16016 / NCTC 11634 / CL345/78) TaxID=865938 RepID=F0P295_WEEVC|nr:MULTISPECIES: riboflavin synthase [Weeksella]ADX67785.1 riboflavin synthase, alpha subunit [Weeksella virosa DSM 16922]MDK7374075.1 riboflavin synthase [Weeksella virosa]MDK7674330.1 riboflavin synthase [Weeksella virosa]OFM82760.1 riboflavin synthase subunit alpha [Weeksella sp. HMSC059D05]SUP54084.1 Riboflavin synthase alpha chain [Weeksella virosa]
MFTGIVEAVGHVRKIEKEEKNIHFWIEAPFVDELKIDQSVAHNGVCLTVVDFKDNLYKVTAIDETLSKTNLARWQINDLVNLERCMPLNARLDGHIVQGHVDQIGQLINIEEQQGSFLLTIAYDEEKSGNVTVEKGSICLNGISLTVVNSKIGEFSVAIIPYTWEFTNLHQLNLGDELNLEFDIVGKYIKRLIPNIN